MIERLSLRRARALNLNPTRGLRSSPVQAVSGRFDRITASCVNYGMASKERPMKRIATAALAVCLLSGSSALAQPGQNNNNNSSNHGSNYGNHNANNANRANSGQPHSSAPVTTTQHTAGGPKGPPPGPTTQFNQNNNNNNNRNWNQNNNNHNQNNNNSNNRNNNQSNNNNNRNNNWSNNWRPSFGAPGYHPGGARPTYSRSYFPQIYHPTQRYNWRGSRWYGPPGFAYRPYYYGQFFPLAWLATQFWINDYYYYNLPVPPYGYEWVRNGPDALLVNISNGMVVEAVPGIFY
jgi:Ni/Co efflux regulator RcnB